MTHDRTYQELLESHERLREALQHLAHRYSYYDVEQSDVVLAQARQAIKEAKEIAAKRKGRP